MKNFLKKIITISVCSFLLLSYSGFAQNSVDTWSKKQTTKWFNSGTWLNGCQLKPHKSTNQKAFAKEYMGNKALWDKTFAWLKNTDLENLAPGRYVIEEGNSTATVSEAPAPELDKVKWEVHKNFNDIQYIVKGKAQMAAVPVEQATVTEAFDSKRDIGFFEAKGPLYEAVPGTFFIFTPSDVHRPGIKAEGSDTVKKIVIKVKAAKQD